MSGMQEALNRLARYRQQFDPSTAMPAAGTGGLSKLHTQEAFGSNPGELTMRYHVPDHLPAGRPLIVILHGCTETAQSHDFGSGWTSLAARLGFALLMPEQQTRNNPNRCFNWFLNTDTRRNCGEALSIRQMIETMVETHAIDRQRIYVAGLSAGGAMAAELLASFPDVFAAGAIVAGLPAGAASSVPEALDAMARGRVRSPQQWGDLVRQASSHAGPWPRISIWHGDADRVVNPINAEATVSQWTNVHGVQDVPSSDIKTDVYRRRVWRNTAGASAVEWITIAGFGHAVPLALQGEAAIGHASRHHLDAGISAPVEIASFFGLKSESAGTERFRGGLNSKPDRASSTASNGAYAQSQSAPGSAQLGQRSVLFARAIEAAKRLWR